jgi:hypothetical protein
MPWTTFSAVDNKRFEVQKKSVLEILKGKIGFIYKLVETGNRW